MWTCDRARAALGTCLRAAKGWIGSHLPEGWRDEALMRLEPLRRHAAVWQAAWQLDRLRPRLAGRNADELAFLPAVIEITETPASPLGRTTGAVLVALFNAALLWATFGQVDIHATAQGRIIPAGKTKPVAAPESGTVAAIHVKDGDRVTAGQVLIELDRTGSEADTARLARERLEQVVTAARLRALLRGSDRLELPAGVKAPPDLLAVHQAELAHKLADYRSTIGALERERDERRADMRAAEAEIARLRQTVPLLAERARIRGGLAEKGLSSKLDYLQVQQDLVDRRQELEGATHKLTEARAAVDNVAERLKQADGQFRAESFGQLADAEQKAASLAQDLAKARDRDRLLRLTAPVDGVVQQLAVNAPGAVVTLGAPVLMVVPDDVGIAVEAALPNKDAGFVLPGQKVAIKVEAFPFTRYGTVPGEVTLVSSDAVQGPDSDPIRRTPPDDGGGNGSAGRMAETGGPVYSVRIHPDRATIRADGKDVALTPGMAVTAEIKTGRRRVISYLLDPVIQHVDESFRER